jgi:hypothetical protein
VKPVVANPGTPPNGSGPSAGGGSPATPTERLAATGLGAGLPILALILLAGAFVLRRRARS